MIVKVVISPFVNGKASQPPQTNFGARLLPLDAGLYVGAVSVGALKSQLSCTSGGLPMFGRYSTLIQRQGP